MAITLEVYGMPYQQLPLSGFNDRAEVRASNPLGRIPALILDNGEVLVDSGAIIDYLDETFGRDRALTPAAGPDRRAVLKVAAIMKVSNASRRDLGISSVGIGWSREYRAQRAADALRARVADAGESLE